MPTTTTFSLEAAERFVLAEGLPRQRAYWKAAFGWGPVEVLLFELETFQGEDGGWGRGLDPDLPPGGSSLHATVTALRLLSGVNLGEDIFEVWPRTAAYLTAQRAGDGGWGPVGGAVWLTAAIGAYMGAQEDDPAIGEAAAKALVHRWPGADTVAPETAWMALALGVRSTTPGADVVAADCRRVLLRALEDERLALHQLTWLHEATRLAGLPAADALRRGAWERLAGRQQADGSFDDPRSRQHQVDTTVFAARAVVSP